MGGGWWLGSMSVWSSMVGFLVDGVLRLGVVVGTEGVGWWEMRFGWVIVSLFGTLDLVAVVGLRFAVHFWGEHYCS